MFFCYTDKLRMSSFFLTKTPPTKTLLQMVLGWLLLQSLATGISGQERTVSFEERIYNVTESQDTVEVCAVSNIENVEEFLVDIVSSESSLANFATDGADFIGSRQTVIFPVSDSAQRQCVEIELMDDFVVEGDEQFSVGLEQLIGAQPGSNARTTVFIIDDDEVVVQFERPSYTVDEGSPTVEEVCFNSSTGTKQPFNVTVFAAEKPDSSNTATMFADFLPVREIFVFSPSEEGQRFCFMPSIIDDDIGLEVDEEFRFIFNIFTFSIDVGVGSNNEACITIFDDVIDFPYVIPKDREIRVTEDDTTVEVCVLSSNPVKGSFVLETATEDDSATAPDDYMAANASLTFEGDDQEECYQVTILDDEIQEGEEEFFVILLPRTETIHVEVSRIVIYIEDDERCPPFTNEPIDSQFPNITFTWPETEIGNNVSYTCPCQNLTSTKKSATRVCGGNYFDGALWDRVNVIEDCGLSTITLQLCQAQIQQSNMVFKYGRWQLYSHMNTLEGFS